MLAALVAVTAAGAFARYRRVRMNGPYRNDAEQARYIWAAMERMRAATELGGVGAWPVERLDRFEAQLEVLERRNRFEPDARIKIATEGWLSYSREMAKDLRNHQSSMSSIDVDGA